MAQSAVLTKRLLRFLDFNTQQYVLQRSCENYREAMSRLDRLGKLVRLIYQVRSELTPDDAVNVIRTQRHLHSLGFLSEEDPPIDAMIRYAEPI